MITQKYYETLETVEPYANAVVEDGILPVLAVIIYGGLLFLAVCTIAVLCREACRGLKKAWNFLASKV